MIHPEETTQSSPWGCAALLMGIVQWIHLWHSEWVAGMAGGVASTEPGEASKNPLVLMMIINTLDISFFFHHPLIPLIPLDDIG